MNDREAKTVRKAAQWQDRAAGGDRQHGYASKPTDGYAPSTWHVRDHWGHAAPEWDYLHVTATVMVGMTVYEFKSTPSFRRFRIVCSGMTTWVSVSPWQLAVSHA